MGMPAVIVESIPGIGCEPLETEAHRYLVLIGLGPICLLRLQRRVGMARGLAELPLERFYLLAIELGLLQL